MTDPLWKEQVWALPEGIFVQAKYWNFFPGKYFPTVDG
jgi:hypothetical protein